MVKTIVIKDLNFPTNKRSKTEVEWICDSLGLIEGRDTENISFKIMYELLDSFSKNEMVATESIASALSLDPPRINHHVRSLMDSGILYREKRKIKLRGGTLTMAIKEIKRDLDKLFERLLEISQHIDDRMNLN